VTTLNPRRSARAGEDPTRGKGRAARLVGIAVLGLLVFTGCQTDNTPTAYGDPVQAAFNETCTGNAPGAGTTTSIAPAGYCQCAYAVFQKNVPFNDDDKKNRDGGSTFANYSGKVFVDIEKDLKDDPTKYNDNSVVPQNVRDMIAACPKTNEVITPGSTPGSTPDTVIGTGSTLGTTVGATTPGSTAK
jgi:hypothetical protein